MLRYILILFIIFALNIDVQAQFLGGNRDGHHSIKYTSSTNIYAGGNQDGYHSSHFMNSISIFSGGNNDGYHASILINSISIFSGGNNDGYALGSKIINFIWTGDIGTGWNVADNWSSGHIPNINSKVVIPSGVPNYPFINSGIISVGKDPNAANFLCKQILIQNGAQMTLRVNAFMENYGDIDIHGGFYVLNSAMEAVQNLSGGLIQVRTGGMLSLIPN